MQLSQESYRTRWLLLVVLWTICGFALFRQASLVRGHLDSVSQLGLRGAPAASTPLKQPYPPFAADAHVWVRHALALLEGPDLRLRHTVIDNAPNGREVHWNSAWAWCIAGSGWLHHVFTGNTLESSVEMATVWLNPSVQLLLAILISAWATSRGGAVAGFAVAVAIAFHDRMYEGFFPSYVDHHGLLMVSVLGLMLGAVFMGGGWWSESKQGGTFLLPSSRESARGAALFSAFAGACGLWVSAASVIPPIALIGVSGLLATLLQGRVVSVIGCRFEGDLWRLWGRAGAGFSMVFYLVEYFPQHLSMRLEPNHPVHALAWLGGGELIAQISERFLADRTTRWANLRALVWPICAVLVAPTAVLMGGAKVFVVADSFMSRLHSDYIQEFLPLWRTFQGFNSAALLQVAGIGSLPLIAGIATLTYLRKEAPIVLWFSTFAGALLVAMAIWQSRWLLNASAVLVCLGLVVLGCWTRILTPTKRWISIVAMVSALYLPGAYFRHSDLSSQIKSKQVSPKDAAAAFNRDVAAVIRSSQPQGDITLLSSPNSSTAIGYFGRFKTLGTLYWENTEGLKAAASILAAQSDEEAARLIKVHKVTHLALIMEENFIEQYCRLLNPLTTVDEIRRSFGFRILYQKIVPQWLQMIPYSVPPDLTSLKPIVMLFRVNFEQTTPEALYNVALSQIASGAVDEGEGVLDGILRQYPQFSEPWLRKGELLIARKAWSDAAEFILRGISLAPATSRPTLYATNAATFYTQQQHAVAIRLYRQALADQPNNDLASYLAWILSTSVDASLRNGAEALSIAQQIVRFQPNNSAYLSVLSAALAEVGRHAEAVEAAERAVANASLVKDAAAAVFTQRLTTLKSGNPLRFSN